MNQNYESTPSSLDYFVKMAKAGNKDALEELVRGIQDRIYGLSLRMLYHPQRAEDATQEILIKIITRLDSFEGRSSFTTWALRIASNHLLTTRQYKTERWNVSFEFFENTIGTKWPHSNPGNLDEGEMRVLAREVKFICTQVMLLALRRDVRLAFIIGDIFGASSLEGAEILAITPDAFRQRLSRGRKQIQAFMAKHCSLIHPDNECRCTRGIKYFIHLKMLNPDKPLFSNHPRFDRQQKRSEPDVSELDEFGRITATFRSHPDYAAPEAFVGIVKQLVRSNRYELLSRN